MTQNTNIPVNYPMMPPMDDMNKYAHLLQVIEEMGRDIKPTYANNKNAAERLKKNIHTARILVRECVSELERNDFEPCHQLFLTVGFYRPEDPKPEVSLHFPTWLRLTVVDFIDWYHVLV
ncbi:unnamed protein product [Trichobilharzia regenti]|nr:unnamed protein product [Trichobilharzia regenti]